MKDWGCKGGGSSSVLALCVLFKVVGWWGQSDGSVEDLRDLGRRTQTGRGTTKRDLGCHAGCPLSLTRLGLPVDWLSSQPGKGISRLRLLLVSRCYDVSLRG